MIALGVLGVLHAVLLPGFVVAYVALPRLRGSLRDLFILSVPVSLLVNYVAVTALVLLRVYTRPVVLAIALGCFAAFVVCLVHHGRQAPDAARPKRVAWGWWDYALIGLTLAAFVIFLRRDLGTVFTHWDAVVSWNAWAMRWSSQIVLGSRGYPQLLPMLLSIVYVITGSTNVQTVAKVIVMALPLWGAACLWAAAAREPTARTPLVIAALLAVSLVTTTREGSVFLFSGYTDPIMAAFGAFAIYAVCLWRSEQEEPVAVRTRVLAVLGLSLATSALVKQTGVLLAPLALGMLLADGGSFRRIPMKTLIWCAGLAALVTIHWHVFSVLYWNDIQELQEYEGLIDSRRWIRPLHGMRMLLGLFGAVVVVFVIAGAFTSPIVRRLLVWIAAPLLLFWTLLVSYDLRSAMIAFPAVAVAAGAGMAALGRRIPLGGAMYIVLPLMAIPALLMELSGGRMLGAAKVGTVAAVLAAAVYAAGRVLDAESARAGVRRQLVAWSLVVACIGGLVALVPLVPDQRLLAANTERRLAAYDLGYNAALAAYFEREPSSRVMSCWGFLINVLATGDRVRFVGDCSIDKATQWIESPGFSHFLLFEEGQPRGLRGEIRQLIAARGVAVTETPFGDHLTAFTRR